MSLISDEYRALNEKQHKDRSSYGKSGSRWAPMVFQMVMALRTRDVLDYGCGKSTLALHLPFTIQQYDPCIPKYSELPKPADIVTCTDVLEHIEPDCIEDVLKHLCSMVKRRGLFSACTKPALKLLSDGRNAHLIQESPRWWFNQISKYINIVEFKHDDVECVFIVEPYKKEANA